MTLVEIMDTVGPDRLSLLTVFLSQIFLVMVHIRGVSTVFRSAMLLMAIRWVFLRKLWLPEIIGTG